jgi:hypothetical protein
MRIWTVAIIGTGVLGVFLVLGRGDSKSDRSPPNTPPIPRVSLPAILQLGGQQAARCATGPIYHRFAQMTIQLDGLPAEDADRLVVTVQPLWPGRQERDSARTEMPRVRMTRRSIDRAEAVLGLESDHGPMPVGPYCVVIYHWQEGIFRQIAEQPFFVIFNAFDPVDRSAHHWRAGVYLTDTMYMAQKSEEGEPRLYDWHLGILRDQVFCLAIRTVAGSRDPRVAVQRVAAATACRIEGFWPELAAADGHAGGGGRERTDAPEVPSFRSIPQRLRNGERRGQCFDYTALSVALLRSVGLVAAAASVMDPDVTEHPQAPNRYVSWSYHVWTEVFVDGKWRAMDVAYLAPVLREGICWNCDPGLQRFDGPWFTRMIGDESRVYRQKGRQIADVTSRYRRN